MQPVTGLVVFDMDGVLADTVSSWVYVHQRFGVDNDHSLRAYLNGEIDDLEFIRRDIRLWLDRNPMLTIGEVRNILDGVPLMNGAVEAVRALREGGVKTAIVSAGIDLLAERLAIELRTDLFYANGLIADCNGRLTGEGVLNVELMGKDRTVSMIGEMLGIEKKDIVSVGNSKYDIPMFDASGMGIAFCPADDEIRDRADTTVDEKRLDLILEHIL